MQFASNSRSPVYCTVGAPEIDGNPLIAHLPLAPETDDDAYLALGIRPNFQPKDRELRNSIRLLRINQLRRFFIPVSPVHRRALRSICTTVMDGYMARNPFTPDGQRLLHGLQVDIPIKPAITMVTGHSGMGKSTLIDRITDYFGGQLWQHQQFKGQPFPEKQLLWLRRNVPHRCTVGALCATFGDYADRALGLKLYSGIFSKIQGRNQAQYLDEIRRIVTAHHVGFLVLDEFQNLSLMGGGAKTIIALLVNLRDELGLPIIVVGTYKSLKLLRSELSAARRLVEGGYFDLERPLTADDVAWQEMCEAAWEFQWVRDPVPYSSGIGTQLYKNSQGITAVMLANLATAQSAAIEDGSERVDETLLQEVFDERMKPLHSAIRALSSSDPRLIDEFDDLFRNAWPQIDGSAGAAATEMPGPQPELDEPSCIAPAPSAVPSAGAGLQAADRNTESQPQPPGSQRAKSPLTEEQIRKMVTAGSTKDLLEILGAP
nr:AAA family ATPase [uncultured Roseateles sp.]